MAVSSLAKTLFAGASVATAATPFVLRQQGMGGRRFAWKVFKKDHNYLLGSCTLDNKQVNDKDGRAEKLGNKVFVVLKTGLKESEKNTKKEKHLEYGLTLESSNGEELDIKNKYLLLAGNSAGIIEASAEIELMRRTFKLGNEEIDLFQGSVIMPEFNIKQKNLEDWLKKPLGSGKINTIEWEADQKIQNKLGLTVKWVSVCGDKDKDKKIIWSGEGAGDKNGYEGEAKLPSEKDLKIGLRPHQHMDDDKKWALVPFGKSAFKISLSKSQNKNFRDGKEINGSLLPREKDYFLKWSESFNPSITFKLVN